VRLLLVGIFGVVTGAVKLAESDHLGGGTLYEPGRVIDFSTSDRVTLDKVSRQVSVCFTTSSGVDEVRIITGADRDGDGVGDSVDNCPDAPNPGQADQDGDGIGNPCDPDRDGDGVANELDNCPTTPNPGQADLDGDGLGDACDSDRDDDGVLNDADNCPEDANPDQANLDLDTEGDACDADLDNDTVPNDQDNCPEVGNEDQTDVDGDGYGDVCDGDLDDDGVANEDDNCPRDPNPAQDDTDGDAIGDACDPLTYLFDGFFAPIGNPPTVNSAEAGSTVPVKFSLQGDQGLEVIPPDYLRSVAIDCATGDPLDDGAPTMANGKGLKYDALADRYVYNWKTDRTWGGTCRELILKMADGGVRHAVFRFH
jgi:hypothetical protein